MGFLRLPKSLSRKRAGAGPRRKSGPDPAMDDTSRTLDCSYRSDDDGADAPLGDRSLSQDAGRGARLDERLDVAHDASWDIQDILSGCDDVADGSPDIPPGWDIEDILRGRDDIASSPPNESGSWDVEPVVRRTPLDWGRPERPGLASSLSSGSSRSSTSSRVSFVDAARGLTPRHVVTQIHHRPRTTVGEKRELHYTGRDFAAFQKEELYEQIEEKIRLMESGSIEAADDAEIRKLVARVQRLQ